jgi:hypothetical protein
MGVIDGKTTMKLWKPLYRNLAQELRGEMFPESFAPGRQPITALIDGPLRGLWENFFLSYEEQN